MDFESGGIFLKYSTGCLQLFQPPSRLYIYTPPMYLHTCTKLKYSFTSSSRLQWKVSARYIHFHIEGNIHYYYRAPVILLTREGGRERGREGGREGGRREGGREGGWKGEGGKYIGR